MCIHYGRLCVARVGILKRTGWYSGHQKPVRVGVYERNYGTKVTNYCWWDGKVFGCAVIGFSAYVNYQQYGASLAQNLEWRGITKESK